MRYSDVPVFPSRQDVVTLSAQRFGGEEPDFIMDILDLYGVNANEPHREFVQAALVFYAKGDIDKLLLLVEEAKRDYRRCLYHEAFSSVADLEVKNSGWSFTIRPLLPHYSPVTKEVAAQLLNVHWKQLDEWVAEGKLNPLAKTRGQYRFTIEELEQFQRENESEVDIAEIWQAQQTK
jgi:hypothetical protein